MMKAATMNIWAGAGNTSRTETGIWRGGGYIPAYDGERYGRRRCFETVRLNFGMPGKPRTIWIGMWNHQVYTSDLWNNVIKLLCMKVQQCAETFREGSGRNIGDAHTRGCCLILSDLSFSVVVSRSRLESIWVNCRNWRFMGYNKPSTWTPYLSPLSFLWIPGVINIQWLCNRR